MVCWAQGTFLSPSVGQDLAGMAAHKELKQAARAVRGEMAAQGDLAHSSGELPSLRRSQSLSAAERHLSQFDQICQVRVLHAARILPPPVHLEHAKVHACVHCALHGYSWSCLAALAACYNYVALLLWSMHCRKLSWKQTWELAAGLEGMECRGVVLAWALPNQEMEEAEALAQRNAGLVHAITYQEALAGVFEPPPPDEKATSDAAGLYLNCVGARAQTLHPLHAKRLTFADGPAFASLLWAMQLPCNRVRRERHPQM
jgi:hypothetical protein